MSVSKEKKFMWKLQTEDKKKDRRESILIPCRFLTVMQ